MGNIIRPFIDEICAEILHQFLVDPMLYDDSYGIKKQIDQFTMDNFRSRTSQKNDIRSYIYMGYVYMGLIIIEVQSVFLD
jgi:hypothetical protein